MKLGRTAFLGISAALGLTLASPSPASAPEAAGPGAGAGAAAGPAAAAAPVAPGGAAHAAPHVAGVEPDASAASAEASPPRLVDATAGSGIVFKNRCGAQAKQKLWLTETMGAGAAWLDYDLDGTLDLYLVNGSSYDRAPGAGEPNRLFRGDGAGRFTDVTGRARVGDRGWGYGVAVGDIDNDGDPDVYVTNLGANVLYRNNGDGTFTDITARAGVGRASWSTSAAFFDMDGDGDLDLYVAAYVELDRAKVPARGSKEAAARITCNLRGIPVYCGPLGLTPAQDTLYRNNGDGTFSDATRAAGVWLDPPLFGLGVVTLDYDDDGDQDVYVANDSCPNLLWRNRGDGTFEEVGMESLSALSAEGMAQAGMGVDAGDYDGDGRLDLVVTNFSSDLNTIHHNEGGRYFSDESLALGMDATYMNLSWGVGFEDFDEDGDEDLFIANGHVYPQVDDYDIGTRYRQANDLFENVGSRFKRAPAKEGLAPQRSFRGTAFGDYDSDGDVDVLVTALDDPVLLLRNETHRRGHFLEIRLEGAARPAGATPTPGETPQAGPAPGAVGAWPAFRPSNRDGVGARVTITAGGRRIVRERKGGGSYLSASDPRLHFGLGEAAVADLVEVRWPSGLTELWRDVPADRLLVLREGAGARAGPSSSGR